MRIELKSCYQFQNFVEELAALKTLLGGFSMLFKILRSDYTHKLSLLYPLRFTNYSISSTSTSLTFYLGIIFIRIHLARRQSSGASKSAIKICAYKLALSVRIVFHLLAEKHTSMVPIRTVVLDLAVS